MLQHARLHACGTICLVSPLPIIIYISKWAHLPIKSSQRQTRTVLPNRLRDIVTHANMIWSAFASERFLREADAVLAVEAARADAAAARADADASDTAGGEEAGGGANSQQQQQDEDEEGLKDVFDPVAGSVAFGSAADGWAFRLSQFAEM